MNSVTLGWDLGGAHVKAVLLDADGSALHAMQAPCPLWRGMSHLEVAIDAVLDTFSRPVARHAVTMTGELADIFSSRHEGVHSLASAMHDRFSRQGIHFYAARHGFIPYEDVNAHSADIASANWHASASFVAGNIADALLIDVGSTTSDLVVLHDGRAAVLAYSDAERMRHEELIYTGVIRTPVMAVVRQVPFDGAWQGVAAEHFATMADVYRLTVDLTEACDMAETADGAGKSLEDSARRLARMVGRDLADAGLLQWRALALAIKSAQLRTLQQAAERAYSRGLLAEDAPLVGAGAGRFLVRELARNMARPYRDVAEWVTAEANVADWAVTCLPAYAVARLSASKSR